MSISPNVEVNKLVFVPKIKKLSKEELKKAALLVIIKKEEDLKSDGNK